MQFFNHQTFLNLISEQSNNINVNGGISVLIDRFSLHIRYNIQNAMATFKIQIQSI